MPRAARSARQNTGCAPDGGPEGVLFIHTHFSRFLRFAPLLGLLAAGLAVATSAFAGAVHPRASIDRQSAARAALARLHVNQHAGAEIVFSLARKVPAGTSVTLGGPTAPATAGRVVSSSTKVILRPQHAAWFFYEDLGPFQAYQHPGRVVLVDAVTGRVSVSKSLSWPPMVGGRLPTFLRSADAYAKASNRIFYRPYEGGSVLGRSAKLAHALDSALHQTQARRAASLLAAEHSCVVLIGDSLPGGFYELSRVPQSRMALASRFSQLVKLASGFRSSIYPPSSHVSPMNLVRNEISQHGCRDVLLWIAGSGYQGLTAVNIGMRVGTRGVLHQDVTLTDLRRLISSEPQTTFKLVIDAPFASGFQQLAGAGNVVLVATPVAPRGRSFTYLPEARVGGALRRNDTNPLRLIQLTDRLVYGLNQVIDDPCEETRAEALARSGKSALAYFLARALARGGPVDWVARTGVGSPPEVRVSGFTDGPPKCSPADVVTAANDAYNASNTSKLDTQAAQGVLANDSDNLHNPLSVDQLNGTGGTAPFTGISSKGAMVSLNADGSFSYDPTGSATLQALGRGQSTVDSFTYGVSDGHGGTATATVRITVTGAVNHPPVAVADSYADDNDAVLSENSASGVLANDTDADGDALSVDQLNGTGGTAPFIGTSAKGATVTLNADGSFSYDPTGSSALQAVPDGQSTTDTFTYRANDGHGGTSTATATITVTGAVNHPPVAVDDTASTTNAASFMESTSVLANDTDPDGDSLSIDQLNGVSGTPPLNGTSALGASVKLGPVGKYIYDPTGSATLQALGRGQSTVDSFTYGVDDGHGGTATATVRITVTGAVNHPPVAVADSYADDNDAVLSENSASGVLANDTDADGDALSVDQLNGTGGTAPFIGTSAKGATVTLNADGSFSYDPTGSSALQAVPDGQSTTDTFTYRANDGHGGTSTATATITVTGAVNHPPVAVDDTASTTNAASFMESTSVLANDTDPDGDSLSIDQLNGVSGTPPLNGTSALGASVKLGPVGKYIYDPTGSATLQALGRGQSTVDSFTYGVDDGHGGTATATVRITVTGAVNHPPVAVADSYADDNDAVLSENSASGVLANDTDADGDALSVDQLNGTGGTAPFIGTSAKGATVTLNADGSFSYDPTGSSALQAVPDGQSTTDTFTYRANDGHGGTSTATATITVTGAVTTP